jgi:hypothetical protein
MPVEGIESFVFFALVIELQTTIGHHPIDIQYKQANLFGDVANATGHYSLLDNTSS